MSNAVTNSNNANNPNTPDETKITKLCYYTLQNIDLSNVEMPEEYFYSCLPLCLLDAVYSIGVHYTTVRNVVNSYCKNMSVRKIREPKDQIPDHEEHTIDDLISAIGDDIDAFSDNVVCNHNLTPDGTSKAEVVLECAQVLRDAGIQTIRDFNHVMYGESETANSVEEKLNDVTRKNSCLSVNYLMMLCGDENMCKPDRHIIEFVTRALGYQVNDDEAGRLLSEAAVSLKREYPSLTLRTLDYAIWNKMSSVSSTSS